ncbi:MAG: hypothetical protein CL908_08975 [Deltaproteobacteria bacterium]|nr:hypothetical protein [Deltaproteobacteria bacterium]
MSDEIRGSCLCGEVTYEILASDIGVITTCYCSLCRKNHGAERRLRAPARARGLRWVSGEQALRRYRYTPERQKVFCGVCGTPLVNEYLDQPELLGLAIATLDQDPGKRNVLHLFAASKPEWIEIRDDLPRLPTVPDVVGEVIRVDSGHIVLEIQPEQQHRIRVHPEAGDVSVGDRIRASLAHGESGFRLSPVVAS